MTVLRFKGWGVASWIRVVAFDGVELGSRCFGVSAEAAFAYWEAEDEKGVFGLTGFGSPLVR